jgi:AraC family transcriptional regulator
MVSSVSNCQDARNEPVLAKIAVELERALALKHRDGTPGRTRPRVIARGDDWTVADVVCTSGPQDRAFEERHERPTIAIVLAGSFQYRSAVGRELMTPGSLMLGSPGQCFECGHEHGEGDRCVSFWYAPDYFERLARDAGARGRAARFAAARVPPVRSLSSLVAYATAGAAGLPDVPWSELGVNLAVRAIELAAHGSSHPGGFPPNAESRVTRSIRTIDRHSDAPLTLEALATEAGLSPYHFLRTFERLTGVTPHQYVRRVRLREAANRLVAETGTVLEIALDCGFGDVSNFNRAFRTEFGRSPLAFRRVRSVRL